MGAISQASGAQCILRCRDRFAIDNTAVSVSPAGQQRFNTGKIKLNATNFNDDEIEVSYFGSDSFYIEVDHGPIQNIDDVEIVVPIIDTDDWSTIDDKLQIISLSNGVDDTCQGLPHTHRRRDPAYRRR